MVEGLGDEEEVAGTVGDYLEEFGLAFDGEFLDVGEDAVEDGLEVGDVVVLVGEEVADGVVELLEVHQQLHLAVEQSERQFQKVHDAVHRLFGLVELAVGDDGAGGDVVGRLYQFFLHSHSLVVC